MSTAPEFDMPTGNEGDLVVPEAKKDRRQWTRLFPDHDGAEVELRLSDGRSWTATIADESFGGISLFTSTDLPVQEGDTLEVMFYGAPMSCTVRKIDDQGGHWRVGCEWYSRRR